MSYWDTFLYEEKYFPVCVELADKLKPVAAKYEVTCGQLAINWLNYQEGITSILMGGKTPEQIQQNIDVYKRQHMYRHIYGMKLAEMHVDDWTIARLLEMCIRDSSVLFICESSPPRERGAVCSMS